MQFKSLAAAAAGLMLLLSACSAGESQEAPPAPQVTVATPLVDEVVNWDDYVGRFEAIQRVEVKPRVSGYLQRVHFRDGDYVQAGETLFTIDPRPARAQLDQARAQLARAEASLANARTELARSETLFASRAVSEEEVEARRAAVRTGVADVNAARAAVRANQLTVGFTTVHAPISGRVSERLVDVGNSVTADQTVLTTIVSTNPIHFAFEGSEALLLKYQRQGAEDAGAERGTPVRIRLQDESTYAHAGTLDFVDTSIGATSGTVRARAVVQNPDGFLKPGMFGHLRLAGSAPYKALLVPDTAIVTDAARKLLYVVDKEGTVVPKPVELGPTLGDLRVIRSGIEPSDRVIIGGIQRAMPGQKVTAKAGQIKPPTIQEGKAVEPANAPAASVATPAEALR